MTRYDSCRPGRARGHRRELPASTRRRTACSGHRRLQPDLLVQKYGRVLRHADRLLPRRMSRRARVTPAPSYTDSWRTSPAALARRPHVSHLRLQGKQVATTSTRPDVCASGTAFADAPRAGAVYNIGGGRANSVSILRSYYADGSRTPDRTDAFEVEIRRRAATWRPHLLHQRPRAVCARTTRAGTRDDHARRHPRRAGASDLVSRVLVTGGAGFIGSHPRSPLRRRLRRDGADNPTTGVERVPAAASSVEGDVADGELVTT